MSDWQKLFDGMEEALQRTLDSDDDLEAMTHNALDAVPDNWAKVDGSWVHLPDEHFVSIAPNQVTHHADGKKSFDPSYGCDWRMEHSLPCRVRGLANCGIEALWQSHLEEDGHWWPGRFKFVNLQGTITDAEGDTRTFDLEPAALDDALCTCGSPRRRHSIGSDKGATCEDCDSCLGFKEAW